MAKIKYRSGSSFRDAIEPTLLYQGNWSSGNLTVDGLSGFTMFALYFTDNATPMFAFSPTGSSDFRAIGGYAISDSVQRFYTFTSSRSGDTLTYGSGIFTNGSGSGIIVANGISYIYGIV